MAALAAVPAADRRAVVLYGAAAAQGGPDEADTLVQVETVQAALASLGYAVTLMAVDLDLAPVARLARRRFDLVVNLVESLRGDGRLIHLVPAVLESVGVCFTGAPAAAIAASTDKILAKRLMRDAGIPTPDWCDGDSIGDLTDPHARYIIKSVCEDASIGLDAGSVVAVADVHQEIAARQARFGGAWFAERYIEGREFNLSILEGARGRQVLPVAEIHFVDYPADRPRIVDYEAKWLAGSFAFDHTPRHFIEDGADASLVAELRRLALECWRLFGMRGYARVDFRVDAAGRPWVLEVNANPCLSPDAGLMAAAERAGLTVTDVIAMIAAAAQPRRHRMTATAV
jgi:D-alanine-D-alanine ligase